MIPNRETIEADLKALGVCWVYGGPGGPNAILQHPVEFSGFADYMRDAGAASFLEIGSHNGRLLRYIKGWGFRVMGVEQYPSAAIPDDIRQHILIGNSQDSEIVSKACAAGPWDVVFIDGDHTEAGVTADFNNFKGAGKIIAFHDIWCKTCPVVGAVFEKLSQSLLESKEAIDVRTWCCHDRAGIGVIRLK